MNPFFFFYSRQTLLEVSTNVGRRDIRQLGFFIRFFHKQEVTDTIRIAENLPYIAQNFSADSF